MKRYREVICPRSRFLKEAAIASIPLQILNTSERDIPAFTPIVSTNLSTWRVEMPFTWIVMMTA